MDKTIFAAYAAGAIGVLAAIFWPRRAKAEGLDTVVENMVQPSTQIPLAVTANPTPRGIRNNNPGNIEASSIQWRGQIGQDGRYAKFDTAVNGIRAMLLEIFDSIERDGDNTLRKLIAQWAPSTENNTAAYIADVVLQTGLNADKLLDYRANAISVAKGITRHENGFNPYTEQQFRDAYYAAGKYL